MDDNNEDETDENERDGKISGNLNTLTPLPQLVNPSSTNPIETANNIMSAINQITDVEETNSTPVGSNNEMSNPESNEAVNDESDTNQEQESNINDTQEDYSPSKVSSSRTENSDSNEEVNDISETDRTTEQEPVTDNSILEEPVNDISTQELKTPSKPVLPTGSKPCPSGLPPSYDAFHCKALFEKRNPFNHNPPRPEERRARIENPRTPKEYIINLREDLADFQESHGLPRTRDYSFLSLGLALAQETARALCSLFFMFIQLFPILAIVSLILRFALDKLIEIFETTDSVQKVKKSIVFSIQMLLILIPLWIFLVTILIPLMALIFSIVKRFFRFKGGKSRKAPPHKPKEKGKKDCFMELFF